MTNQPTNLEGAATAALKAYRSERAAWATLEADTLEAVDAVLEARHMPGRPMAYRHAQTVLGAYLETAEASVHWAAEVSLRRLEAERVLLEAAAEAEADGDVDEALEALTLGLQRDVDDWRGDVAMALRDWADATPDEDRAARWSAIADEAGAMSATTAAWAMLEHDRPEAAARAMLEDVGP